MTVDCCTGTERFVNENCIRMMTTAAAMAAREEFLCDFFFFFFWKFPKRAAAAILTNSTKEEIAFSVRTELHNTDKLTSLWYSELRNEVPLLLWTAFKNDKLNYLLLNSSSCETRLKTLFVCIMYYCWRTDALFEPKTTSAVRLKNFWFISLLSVGENRETVSH